MKRYSIFIGAALLVGCHQARLAAEDRCAKYRRETAEWDNEDVDSLTFSDMQVDSGGKPTSGMSGSPHLDFVRGYKAPLLLQFVIDTTGSVVPKSFTPRHVGDSALVEAARTVFPQWAFEPGYVDGCKVNLKVLYGVSW